jgi:hypothetical protein
MEKNPRRRNQNQMYSIIVITVTDSVLAWLLISKTCRACIRLAVIIVGSSPQRKVSWAGSWRALVRTGACACPFASIVMHNNGTRWEDASNKRVILSGDIWSDPEWAGWRHECRNDRATRAIRKCRVKVVAEDQYYLLIPQASCDGRQIATLWTAAFAISHRLVGL